MPQRKRRAREAVDSDVDSTSSSSGICSRWWEHSEQETEDWLDARNRSKQQQQAACSSGRAGVRTAACSIRAAAGNSAATVEAALQAGTGALAKVTVAVLQAYLRSAGLRTSGLKAELIDRVQRHHALHSSIVISSAGATPATASATAAAASQATTAMMQQNPECSFSMDCTGDVCKGDTVLFKQGVYGGFDVGTRRGALIGRRLVAGRVIRESYGAEKQQHTFSIEVLWSSGTEPLQPMAVLLIKGRNLYRRVAGFGVRRQPWADEAQRAACLAEKHARGDAARAVRAKRVRKGARDRGGKHERAAKRQRTAAAAHGPGAAQGQLQLQHSGPRRSSRWPALDQPEPAESSEWSQGSEAADGDGGSSADSDGVEIMERPRGDVAAAGSAAAAARRASRRGARRGRCEDAPWQPMRAPVRQPLTMPFQGGQLQLGCGGNEGRDGGQDQQGCQLGGLGGLQMSLGWGGNTGRDQHVRKHAPRAAPGLAGQGRQPLQPADVNRGRPAAAGATQTQPQWAAGGAGGAYGGDANCKRDSLAGNDSGLMYVHMHMPATATGTQCSSATASRRAAARASVAPVAPVGAPAGQRPYGVPHLCRCGGEAAKACAFGMCGGCCQGRGCARHAKAGLAGVAGHRGGGQRGAATGSVAALKRLQAHRMR